MNINLKLDIPITNGVDSKVLKVDSNLFLAPFYCLETDILFQFSKLTEEDNVFVRKAIFNSSITVDRLTEKIENLQLLTAKQLFSLRRDYVICLVTNELAKRLAADAQKAVSKSKTLGDFSVSVSNTADTTSISKVFSDSSECIEDLKQLIQDTESDAILPTDFVKGRYNTSNIQANDRLWWLKDLDGGARVIDGYASNKVWYAGNKYKTATLNRKYYEK